MLVGIGVEIYENACNIAEVNWGPTHKKITVLFGNFSQVADCLIDDFTWSSIWIWPHWLSGEGRWAVRWKSATVAPWKYLCSSSSQYLNIALSWSWYWCCWYLNSDYTDADADTYADGRPGHVWVGNCAGLVRVCKGNQAQQSGGNLGIWSIHQSHSRFRCHYDYLAKTE